MTTLTTSSNLVRPIIHEPGRVSVSALDLADTLAEVDRLRTLAEVRLADVVRVRLERDEVRAELERTRGHLSSALREVTLD